MILKLSQVHFSIDFANLMVKKGLSIKQKCEENNLIKINKVIKKLN